MSSYDAPIENISIFNDSLFNQPEVILTQAEADLLYLSKTKSDISTSALTTFNGQVNVGGNATVGTNGSSNNLNLKSDLRLYDITSPYISYSRLYSFGTGLNYISQNIPSTAHYFFCYNSGGNLTGSLFEITPTVNVSRQIHEFTNRLKFTATSYSFPFASNQSLGYVLKATGTSQTVTSATPTSILTTASIPIGVWRIDFSVQNTITAAGTITQSQSYISTTLNGAIATAVAYTGSIIRSHVSEAYAINDVQVITSSFTYNQSTAGVLYLNILRTFTGGTFNFIGEVSITRIA